MVRRLVKGIWPLLVVVVACGSPDPGLSGIATTSGLPSTTITVATAPATTVPTTTTTSEPVWTIHNSDATEGFGIYDGGAAAQMRLFDFDGGLVAEHPGDFYQGDAGRVYYWFPDNPGLTRDSITSLIPDVECQPPFPGFDPAGPFLATCGDPDPGFNRPRTIVEIDPATREILARISGPEAYPYSDGWIAWAATGPDGEVIAQISLECEVPVIHVLHEGSLRPLLPLDNGQMINSIHMGWTSEGDDVIRLLGSACGFGPGPGVARLTDDGSLTTLWDGDGTAFRWVAAPPPTNPNDNIRERRLFAAFSALGVEACCGEPSHGGYDATTGMTWEGDDYYIGATDLATDPLQLDPASEVVERYKVGEIEVAVVATDPSRRHLFACGDTIYSIASVVTGTDVPTRAVNALADALDCNP